MAFNDLYKYYVKTKSNYLSTLKLLEEFDKEHKEGIIEDKYFKRFKKNLDQLKDTYDMICYFFMIWARPTEEEKKKAEDFQASLESGSNEKYDYLQYRDADALLADQEDLIKEIKEYLESKK